MPVFQHPHPCSFCCGPGPLSRYPGRGGRAGGGVRSAPLTARDRGGGGGGAKAPTAGRLQSSAAASAAAAAGTRQGRQRGRGGQRRGRRPSCDQQRGSHSPGVRVTGRADKINSDARAGEGGGGGGGGPGGRPSRYEHTAAPSGNGAGGEVADGATCGGKGPASGRGRPSGTGACMCGGRVYVCRGQSASQRSVPEST